MVGCAQNVGLRNASTHPTRPSISNGWVGLNRLAERVRGPTHLGKPSTTGTGARSRRVGGRLAQLTVSAYEGRSMKRLRPRYWKGSRAFHQAYASVRDWRTDRGS